MDRAKPIMIQGTMSNAGKSLLAAALCRIFRQDGYRVAPFKSQNMALNSFITAEGGEMGRAQVVQAEAAGIAPDVRMNPILLKPTTDSGSQVIVNGQVVGNMRATEYYRRKREFLPAVTAAYESLAAEYDVIVIEGAGSPAEINLKQDDFVNMGLAKLVDAPVLLIGDIDRGGVFAQLYGTIALLEPDERTRVKGTIVNKFRGDRAILEPGLRQLEALCGVPVAGVVPYTMADIDDEDSLTERFSRDTARKLVDIAVIRLPKISNFTDFSPFERYENVSLRYVDHVGALGTPDMILLPGTKSTIADLRWLRERGLEAAILKEAARGTLVFGVCGGYQMLGSQIEDPEQVEACGITRMKGMGLLEMETVFAPEKVQRQTSGTFSGVTGVLEPLNGLRYEGYEIHMGETTWIKEGKEKELEYEPEQKKSGQTACEVVVTGKNLNVYGSYIHGLFDTGNIEDRIVQALAGKKGVVIGEGMSEDYHAFKERQYDQLADTLREYLNMEEIYGMLREAHLE